MASASASALAPARKRRHTNIDAQDTIDYTENMGRRHLLLNGKRRHSSKRPASWLQAADVDAMTRHSIVPHGPVGVPGGPPPMIPAPAVTPRRPVATPARCGGNVGGRRRVAAGTDDGGNASTSSSAEKARMDRNSLAGRRRGSGDVVRRELTPRAAGHTLCPAVQGRHVAVVGDGWGGGVPGGYEAIITEADHKTFTVIAVNGETAWHETHVLQECCIMLSERLDLWDSVSVHMPPAVQPRGPKARRLTWGARTS